MEITINTRKKGTWSQKFDKCQACESSKEKHFAKGLCRNCYFRAYREVQKKRLENGNKS